MSEVVSPAPAWQEVIFQSLKHAGVAQVAYVPDAGHAHVIRRVQADPGMRDGVGMRDRAESAIAERLAPALHERGVRVVRVTGALADRVDAVGQAWQPGAPQPPT